jgi:hypothetical protein
LNGRSVGAVVLGVAVLLGLSACGDRSPWRSAEERINNAFPVANNVLAAVQRFGKLPNADASGKRPFDDEYQTRLRLRALGCAEGYEPSFLSSAAAIRKRLSAACFDKADVELLAWVQRRMLKELLLAPALRPVPETPPAIFSTTNDIREISFAAAAGIAVVTSDKAIEVIDIGSDESLFLDAKRPASATGAQVSPNGQVFAHTAGGDGLRLRESATGELLAAFPDHTQCIWLDADTAVLVRKDSTGSDLLDFQTDQLKPIKGQNAGPNMLVIANGASPGEFVIGGYGTISRFRLHRDATGPRLALLGEGRPPSAGWSFSRGDTTSDGSRFAHWNGRELWITDLSTLETRQVALPDFSVMSVSALSDPDKLLLRAHLTGMRNNYMFLVYSISRQTFSPVEEGEPTAASLVSRSQRPVRIPALDRVGFIAGKSVRLAEDPPHPLSFSAQSFDLYLQEQGLAMPKEQAESTAARLVRATPTVAMPGPIADLSANARVEAIGVYEPRGSSLGAGRGHRRAPINVLVRASDKPIVLVLTSYEAADWIITLGPRAQLKAVLLGGYEESSVAGVGDIRVHRIGRIYAYQSQGGQFTDLQQAVKRWTGKSIETFQGSYAGSSFMVGGI